MSARRISLLAVLCTLVLLHGCSVTPEPIETEDVRQIAIYDRDLIFDAQEPLVGELTLDAAMAMALKYNLENRVRLLEESIANQQLDMTQLDLLPNLAANAGYLNRDNVNASTSVSVFNPDQVTVSPSTSQDQESFNGNGRLTWNLLDFGVSYIQAKQDADRYLIAKKAREKVMLTLLKEVRSAYWQAVAMEQMRDDLMEISDRVDDMLDYWQSVRDQQLRPPVAVLLDIRSLIETRQQLDDIRRAIDTAQAKLANLINAESVQDIQLPKIEDLPELPEISEDLDSMEVIALANSADYTSEVYKVRIEQLESRKAMVRLLPGLEFSYGANYDDNSFLFNNHWGEFGANLTGDLTRLFFVKRIRKFRESNEELSINRKLAINMAVITGVHITWQDYRNSITQLERAAYLQEIDQEISLLTQNAQLNQKESGASAIQSELRAFRSRIGHFQAYSDAQGAYGEYLVSLGLNPIPEDYQAHTVSELSQVLANNFENITYPFTKDGEALLAEQARIESWVEEPQLEEPVDQSDDLMLVEGDIPASTEQTDDVWSEEEEDWSHDSEIADVEDPVNDLESEEEPEENNLELVTAEPTATSLPIGDTPLHAATMAPELSDFLGDFWVKYFPQPELEDYLKQFLNKLPEGPQRDQYLEMFLNKLGGSPDAAGYIQEFESSVKGSDTD